MEQCIINSSTISQYDFENQILADYFLDAYFFQNWKKDAHVEFKKTLELIVSPKCNLGCKYCYVHKYRKQIFDEAIFDEDLTIKNLKQVLHWLEINEFNPNFEIFSGELFAQEIGFVVLETIYEHEKHLPADLRCKEITIPTNFTFLNSDELSLRIEKMKEDFLELGIELHLSASFDGLYMEENRPYTKELDFPINIERKQDYYDKVFAYCKKNQFGLHPMIYSKNIEKWKDNFLWFQENMEKHGIPWEFLYLLQVRNEEWNSEQITEFQKFIDFLYEWVYQKVNCDKDHLLNFVLTMHGFNILSQPFSRTGRGMTCGIQTNFTLRLSDLKVYPCHRLGYKHYYYGELVPDEAKGLKYKNNNIELMTAVYSANKNSMPTCSHCMINELCGGQCFGACHESNKNLFVPIPSVCVLSHALVVSTVQNLIKYNIYDDVCLLISKEQAYQLEMVKKELKL